MNSHFTNYLHDLFASLDQIRATDLEGIPIDIHIGFDQASCRLSTFRQSGNKQYVCGTGANAALASVLALRWSREAKVPTLTFSDSSLVSYLGDEVGITSVLSAPLEWYGKEGDQLVVICDDVLDESILHAIGTASRKNISVVTISVQENENHFNLGGDVNISVASSRSLASSCALLIIATYWINRYMIQEFASDL